MAFAFLAWAAAKTAEPEELFSKPDFQDHYSSLIEEFKCNSGPFARGYYCIFIAKRLFYALVLVLLMNYPKAQLLLLSGMELLVISLSFYFVDDDLPCSL
jgi:hypothetical protein